ncbi:uncharacterized protein LOC125942200 [Dermacentor silvarum]|uniref:uncharacterized protein LOC125942200 n=1 Tax=Dermacentor silvarum TaxID=543639 RepID=UPI00210096BD|nr:uncharacterized protein LOC125942200 [Dermacentor silvarum]
MEEFVEGCAFVVLYFIGSSTVFAPERELVPRYLRDEGAFADYVLKVEGYADSGGIPQEPAALPQAGEHHDNAPDVHAFTNYCVSNASVTFWVAFQYPQGRRPKRSFAPRRCGHHSKYVWLGSQLKSSF